MGQRRGLIDSNVLIAASTLDHIHNASSLDLLESVPDAAFATSIHCIYKCYDGMTRGLASGGAALTPTQASGAIIPYERSLEVLTLTIPEHLAALQRFADLGGVGPRVYDFLIGQVAVVHRIPAIVTWNTKHMRPLFLGLRVLSPSEYLETL